MFASLSTLATVPNSRESQSRTGKSCQPRIRDGESTTPRLRSTGPGKATPTPRTGGPAGSSSERIAAATAGSTSSGPCEMSIVIRLESSSVPDMFNRPTQAWAAPRSAAKMQPASATRRNSVGRRPPVWPPAPDSVIRPASISSLTRSVMVDGARFNWRARSALEVAARLAMSDSMAEENSVRARSFGPVLRMCLAYDGRYPMADPLPE